MKKQTYKGEIKRSFIYSCKRVFLDGPLFMFLIISVVCMLALLLLLPLVLKNGNADAPLFMHMCNSSMDKYYELYKSSGDVEYLHKYQYFSLIVSNNLNYDKFFVEGNKEIAKIEDYHSHNTRRLDVEGMKQLLLKLDIIRTDLGL